MPTYVYQCRQCGRTFEARQSFSDAPLTTCEVCGGELRKHYGSVGVTFNGSGFYHTDSGSGSNSGSGSGSSAPVSPSGSAGSSTASTSTTTSSSSPSTAA